MKTISLKVKRSETVKNVKAMVRGNHGLPQNSLQLFLTGERLMDTQTLVDCGIKNGSTLHLIIQRFEQIKIFIKLVSNQRTIAVEARIFDTIKHIKTVIQTKEGLQSDDFTLVYNGKLLKDDSTVASLKVQSGAMFNLVLTPKEVLSIYVKAPSNGTAVEIEVRVLFTIRDVKAMVGSMIGLCLNDWYLAYAGQQLEDCQTLAYCGIKEGFMLDLLPRKIQIFVKTWTGKTSTLDVDLYETTETVKLKIFQKMKIHVPSHPLRLEFCGRRLEDGRNLANYHIQKDSTLHAHAF